MAVTKQQILDTYKEVLEKGFRPYVSEDVIRALEGSIQYVYDNAAANGGGTGGIPSKYIFGSPGERDTYFAQNPNELVRGLPIITDTGTPGSPNIQTQYWYGQDKPPVYPPITDQWRNGGGINLDTDQIKTVNDLQTITADYIPIQSSTGYKDSPIRDAGDRLISTKSLEVPSGTIYIGRDVAISNGIRAINLIDELNDRTGLFIIEYYDDSGSQPLNTPVLAAIEQVDLTTLSDQTADTAQFIITPTAAELVNKVGIYFTDLSASKDIDFQVRTGSQSGPLVYEFVGSQTTDASGLAEITLTNPLAVLPTNNLYISVNATNMVGTNISSNFVPKSYIKRHVITYKDIALKEDIQSSVTIYDFDSGVPANVEVGTNLGTKTISYNVINASEITSLAIQLNESNFTTLTIPTSDGVKTQSVNFTSVDTSAPTELRFRIVANGNVNSNTDTTQVRAAAVGEKIYYQIGTIDPATVDINTMSSRTVYGVDEFDVTLGPSVTGQDIVFLSPQDRDITEIQNKGFFNTNVISAYTKTVGIRTIGTKLYNSYELPNLNGGLTFNYKIKNN